MSESHSESVRDAFGVSVPVVSGVRCPVCGGKSNRNGFSKVGLLRYRCAACPRTFSDPLGERRLVSKSQRVPVKRAGNPMLMAYRHVLSNEKRHDRDGLERQARMLMEDQNKEFLKRYSAMEEMESARREGIRRERAAKELASVAAGESTAKLAEVGPDERRVRELIQTLRAELNAKS